jgi:hypothetical protein
METDHDTSIQKVLTEAEKEKILKKGSYKVVSTSSIYSQQLSHQKIMGRFIRIVSKKKLDLPGFKAVSLKQLSLYAFPRLITAFFERGHS